MPSPIRSAATAAALAVALVPSLATAASWTSTASISGNEFFDTFDWFTEADPTHGLVNYQSQDAARAGNLSYVDDSGSFVMAVSTVPTALEGRPSVRIQSKQSYEDGVYVINVTHVPVGCSSWPAFWTVTEDIDSWPIGGEIDILENGNDEFPSNLVSAHTQSSCIANANQATAYGDLAYTNCSAYTPENTGCRMEMSGGPAPTWGRALNRAGGGLFAMERSFGTEGHGIRVWYFPAANSQSLPADLRDGSSQVDTDGWGEPYAQLPISDCYADFGKHKIIFDITLCGDWAANTYERSGCAATYQACSAQVAYNGSSYNNTYWSVNSLRLFTSGGGNANAANSPQSNSSNQSHPEAQTGNATTVSQSGAAVPLHHSLSVVAGVAGLVMAFRLLL